MSDAAIVGLVADFSAPLRCPSMHEAITILLCPEVKMALDDVSHREGISTDDLIGQAIKDYLVLRKFRSLRERLAAKAQSQGISTDQDVFDRVS